MFKHIKSLREENNLAQWQVAEYLYCTQRAYSDYETGKTQIPPDVLIALAKFYNTSVDYLLDLTNVRDPYPKPVRKKYLWYDD